MVAEWITKQDPYTCHVQAARFRLKDRLKVKGRNKIFQENGDKQTNKKTGQQYLYQTKQTLKQRL